MYLFCEFLHILASLELCYIWCVRPMNHLSPDNYSQAAWCVIGVCVRPMNHLSPDNLSQTDYLVFSHTAHDAKQPPPNTNPRRATGSRCSSMVRCAPATCRRARGVTCSEHGMMSESSFRGDGASKTMRNGNRSYSNARKSRPNIRDQGRSRAQRRFTRCGRSSKGW